MPRLLQTNTALCIALATAYVIVFFFGDLLTNATERLQRTKLKAALRLGGILIFICFVQATTTVIPNIDALRLFTGQLFVKEAYLDTLLNWYHNRQ